MGFIGATRLDDCPPCAMLGVLPATEVQRRCDRKKLRFAPPSPRDTLVNSAMPKPAPQTFAFEPEHIEAMRKAFDAACARLELSVGRGDHKTELVARRIIELARAGERDANRLAACVLAEFGVGNDGSLLRH